jgi:hypothetical protein
MRHHICKNSILQEQKKYIPKTRQLGLVTWDGDSCKLTVEERMIKEETCCSFPDKCPALVCLARAVPRAPAA